MGILRELHGIEKRFFEIDDEKRTATIHLHFEKPSDLFDAGCLSRQPILRDDFFAWLRRAFQMVPNRYGVKLDILFDDAEQRSEEELSRLFYDNILLECNMQHKEERGKRRLAISLLGLGVLFFVMMMAVNARWPDGGLPRDIFFYISDIGATVTIWEALGILIVQGREHRNYRRALASQFRSVTFRKTKRLP